MLFFSITFGIEFLPFINDFFSSTRQIYQICQGKPKTGNKGKREIINTPMDTDEKEKEKTLNIKLDLFHNRIAKFYSNTVTYNVYFLGFHSQVHIDETIFL